MTNLSKTELREIEMEAAIYEAVADPDHPMLANTKILLSIVQDLQRQVAELEADTRRYRWLRENLHPDHFCAYMHYQPSDALLWKRDAIDAAIDAAIAALNKETTG